jgi:hypothetical protein
MSEWIPVWERLPVKPGEYSKQRYMVQAQEFGQPPRFYVCTCWISSATPLFAKWLLDPDFYGFDGQYSVGETVLYWMPIPEPMPYPTLQMQMNFARMEAQP